MGKANNRSSRNTLVLIYIATMAIAFTTRYGDLQIGFQLQIIIGLFWIAIGMCQLAINGFKFKGVFKGDLIRLIKLYLMPHIVIHCYTICLMAIGKVDWKYFTTNLTVYVPTLLAIIAVYLLGTKAYEYTCVALGLSWFLSVGASLLLKGPAIFPHAILQAYFDPYDQTGGLIVNYLELHDLVLAIGYIIIAFLFSKSRLTKKQLGLLVLAFIVMTLGMKRISILGVLLAITFHVVIKAFNKKVQYKMCVVAGWIAFFLCYFYIYLLSDGSVFYDFIASRGINVMARNYYYKAIMNYATFGPSFMGIGRNVVTRLLNTTLSYLRVGGVHSDIIKMYVENGFIMFGVWLWYYLVFILKFYKKNYGIRSAVLYFGVVIYMFTLYLTDNVEIYFICQIMATMIPVAFALKEKEHNFNEHKIDSEQITFSKPLYE